MATVHKRTDAVMMAAERRLPHAPCSNSVHPDAADSAEEREDESENGEISVEEYSASEGEECSETADSEPGAERAAQTPPPDPPPPLQHAPELVEDLVRSFLLQMGLSRTFDSFQTEWFELLQKGALQPQEDELGPVRDALAHNRLLHQRLQEAQKARDAHQDAAYRARQTVVMLKKERDFHHLQHMRLEQEKKRLTEELKRLKKLCETHESVVKELREKYQTALRQKMLVSIERDRVSAQVRNLDSGLPDSPVNRKSLSETFGGQTGQGRNSQRSPEHSTRVPGEGIATYDSSKDTTKSASCKHPKDSEFPSSSQMNPFLPSIKASSTPSSRVFCFSMTKSLKAHSMAVSYLALHPSKPVVASASDDHLWRIWGLPEGQMIMTGEGHNDWLSSCTFHPKGGCLATTSGDTTVRIWDFARGRCVLNFEGHTHATWGCSFHSCGDFIASCSMDNTAKVWDLNSERCRYTLRGHVDSVNSVSFLQFSNVLLTSSADKTLALWDARTGLCAHTFHGHQHSCNSATFSLQGDTVASCDSYGVLKLWDVRSVAAVATVNAGPHPANQVAFSPDGRVLAMASDDGAVKLLEVASLHMSSLTGAGDSVQSVTFDHQGACLLSAGYNGEICLWS